MLSVMSAVCVSYTAVAGSLESPGAPSSGSGMYSLQNLYDYLTSGTALMAQSGFQEPASAPGSTMKTTKEIGDGVKALFDLCASTTAEDVKSGKPFFCTQPGSWGVRTGTAMVITPTPTPSQTPTTTPTPTPTSSLYGGLVAYYALDDTTGDVLDASGNGHNGTNNGPTRNVTGKINKSFSFDGDDDYINLGSGIPNITAGVTISTWIYPDFTDMSGIWTVILERSYDACWSLMKPNDGSKITMRVWASGEARATSGTLDSNVWTHVVGTYDGSYVRIYINGTEANATAHTGSLNSNTGNVHIGYDTTHNVSAWSGKLDEIAIWNRCISANEVNELWNNGDGKALF